MKENKDIIDMYYRNLEKEFKCETLEKVLGKEYIIGTQFGIGNILRMKIENGLEISKFKVNNTELYFYNEVSKDDILEIGYCYSGQAKILTSPQNKEYFIKEGDIFIYKMLNDVRQFQFQYDNFKNVSINLNFNIISEIMNPSFEDNILKDWCSKRDSIFKDDVLIIKKASYEIKNIAEQIDEISISNFQEYIKLKLKTIEFLDVFFQENAKIKKFGILEKEIVDKSKRIINENIEEKILVKDIARNLNISEYKLQEAFKNITGDTVHEYIIKNKLHRAKDLLINTNMSILEIVNSIGYENPSKFSNLFKRYNNITPLKYRKLNIK